MLTSLVPSLTFFHFIPFFLSLCFGLICHLPLLPPVTFPLLDLIANEAQLNL